MRLYLVHDEVYTYRVIISASSSDEAIDKLHKWLKETKQSGELWENTDIEWIADLCDNDKVIK